MRKTVYRLKKFRLSEISLVDRPACDIATVERIELVKRGRSLELSRQFNQIPAQEKSLMTSEEIDALPDSAFAYIEPGGSKDSTGRTVPRSLRHFPIHDPAHVRNALARVKESKFGAEALPAILDAARKFGIHTEIDPPQDGTELHHPSLFGDSGPNSGVDPDVGFVAESATSHYPPGNSIAGNPDLAGSADLVGEAIAIGGDLPMAPSPGELRKYVPIDSMPITEDDNLPATDATSLAAAMGQSGIDAPLAETCDLLMQVVGNILRSPTVENKKAAIMAAGDEFKSALSRIAAQPDLASRVGLSRWRERAIGIEHAMRTTWRKRALVQALHQLNFTWPAGAAAIRVLGKGDQVLGSLSRSDFQKRGAVLSAASRSRIHQARDILIGMCADSGCEQDRPLSSYLRRSAGESSALAPGEMMVASHDAPGTEPAVELGKLLDNLRHATRTLGSIADEVRKVADASAASIRKSEGSAKVLSALTERIARLEAQPDNSRPQPLRTVEKGTPIALAGSASDDIRLRIAELQNQAAELRKRGDDVAAQKRLSEISVEIIRLSNGMSQPVF